MGQQSSRPEDAQSLSYSAIEGAVIVGGIVVAACLFFAPITYASTYAPYFLSIVALGQVALLTVGFVIRPLIAVSEHRSDVLGADERTVFTSALVLLATSVALDLLLLYNLPALTISAQTAWIAVAGGFAVAGLLVLYRYITYLIVSVLSRKPSSTATGDPAEVTTNSASRASNLTSETTDMRPLDEQVVVIADAATTAGQQTVAALASSGANLALATRAGADLGSMDEQISNISGEVYHVEVPADNDTGMDAIIEEVNNAFDSVDLVITTDQQRSTG